MRSDRFKGKAYGQDVFLARIDKRKARNLFDKGVKIYLVPSNLDPFSDFFPVEIEESTHFRFDANVYSFTNYQCINSNTGFFPSYYINLLSK